MSEVNKNDPKESGFPEKRRLEGKQFQNRETIEEYRLVPVDDYFFESDEKIDIIGIIKELWLNRKLILGFSAAVFLFGLFVYAGSERLYYSEIALVPERTTPQSNRLQQVQQFANIFGAQNFQEQSEISAAMYPGIIESLPFQIELMKQSVYFNDIDQELTIYEYFTEHYRKSLTEKSADILWTVTFGLPSAIGSMFGSDDGGREPIDLDNLDIFDTPKVVDSSIRNIARTMSQRTTITREPQTNLVFIGVSFPDANAAAQISNLIRELLQRYVTEYRTEKALNDLQFIESQYEIARQNYIESQDSLAAFQDRNRNISTAGQQAQEQRLQSEFTLAYELYEFFAKRRSDARIKVQEETPVFRVQEPATVPSTPSHPRASRIILGSVFLGLFLGILLVYLRKGIIKFRQEFDRKDPETI